jgi:hypothetical protein
LRDFWDPREEPEGRPRGSGDLKTAGGVPLLYLPKRPQKTLNSCYHIYSNLILDTVLLPVATFFQQTPTEASASVAKRLLKLLLRPLEAIRLLRAL